MFRRAAPLLITVLFAACRSQIQHGLDERDANEIVSVLTARGFDARKDAEKGKKPTWAIEVDDERATDALRVLTELKLPRPARTTTRDVANLSALIDTPGAERLRQMEALEGDIEQTLETMDGVVSAGVEIVVPAPARPGQVPLPSKASALLRVHPESLERITQQRVQLKELIAGSVEGLHADDVALMVDPIESHVIAPPPVEPSGRLKLMIVVLAVLLTAVAGVLAVMSIHLRRLMKRGVPAPAPARVEAKAVPAAPAAPAPRPVISQAAQRKVA
jgi:type III secretion protein J